MFFDDECHHHHHLQPIVSCTNDAATYGRGRRVQPAYGPNRVFSQGRIRIRKPSPCVFCPDAQRETNREMSVVRLARLAREGLERTQDTIQKHVRQLPDQIEQMGETLADKISHIPLVGRLTGRAQQEETPGSARSGRSHSASGTNTARSSDRASIEPTGNLPPDINDQLDWDKAYIQVPLRRGSSLTQIDIEAALGKGAIKASPAVVGNVPLDGKLGRRGRSNSARMTDEIGSASHKDSDAATATAAAAAVERPTEDSSEFGLPTTFVPEYATSGRVKEQEQSPPSRSVSVSRKKYTAKHETVPRLEHKSSRSPQEAKVEEEQPRTPGHSRRGVETTPPQEVMHPASPKPSPQRVDVSDHQIPLFQAARPQQPTYITHAAPLRAHSRHYQDWQREELQPQPSMHHPAMGHYADQFAEHEQPQQLRDDGFHNRMRSTSQPPRPRDCLKLGKATRVTPILEHRQTGQCAPLPSFDVRDTWVRHGHDMWHSAAAAQQQVPPPMDGPPRWTSAIAEERAHIQRMKEEAAQKLRELDNKERQLMADLGMYNNDHPMMGASMPPGLQLGRNPYPTGGAAMYAPPSAHGAAGDQYGMYNEPGDDIPLLTLYPIGDRSRKVFSTNKRLTTNEVAPVAWKTVNLDGTSAPVMQVPRIMPMECVHSTMFN